MPGSTRRAAGRLTAALFLALLSIASCGENPVDPLPPGTGVIEVAVTTSGADPDPDGYVATLDGTGPALPLPSTGSAGFLDVAVGEHTVALGGLASNCTADAASKSVTVTDGAAVPVSFTVSCSAIPTAGSIRVVTSTIGTNLDTDGYQFSIDNGPAQAIGTTANATVNDVAPGPHTVVLSGNAANCGLDEGTLKGVTVTEGDMADAAFTVTCYPMGPSASESTVQVDQATIKVGFPGQISLPASTITVTVVDGSGTPLRGMAVVVSATGSGNTIVPWPSFVDSGITNANGVATFSLSSTVPETKTITVSANGVILEQTPVITVVKSRSFVGIGEIVPEPSTAGETFQLTVIVGGELGSRPAGGTVSVRSNLEPDAGCDDVPVVSDMYNSTATCEMSLSIVSTHMLTATYSGDSQFEASSSTEVEHVVTAP